MLEMSCTTVVNVSELVTDQGYLTLASDTPLILRRSFVIVQLKPMSVARPASLSLVTGNQFEQHMDQKTQQDYYSCGRGLHDSTERTHDQHVLTTSYPHQSASRQVGHLLSS